MSLSRELAVAQELAREAGAIVLRYYAAGDAEVQFKGHNDPVTEADLHANRFLVEGLSRAFPDDGVIAEEGSQGRDASRSGRFWYVDPLDGTKEFVGRIGEFSVMIGLAVDGEARVGAVYQPTTDTLYSGVVGEGAWFAQGEAKRALKVRTLGNAGDATLAVSRSHRSPEVDRLKSVLGIESEVSSGSVGLKVGLIATGRADLYVHLFRRSTPWDTCGPEAVLRAAGGTFTGLDGAPLRYIGADRDEPRGVLACAEGLAELVLPYTREFAQRLRAK